MTPIRSSSARSRRHGGPIGPRCRGGASSLLRVTSPTTWRAPLSGEPPAGRDAAREVLPVTGLLATPAAGRSA